MSKQFQIIIFFLLTVLPGTFQVNAQTYKEENITFQTDNRKLSGLLIKPNSEPLYPVVILVHGDGPWDCRGFGFYQFLWKAFTDAGFACLSWDKPGVGNSTGIYNRSNIMEERSEVLLAGIEYLKTRNDIDTKRIGLWGISQAGWVMPLAISKSEDLSFMIAVSCAGENSIEQSAYLLKQQLICEGLSEDEATKYADLFRKRSYAKSYEEYLENAKPISEQSYIKSTLKWGGIISEEKFVPYTGPDNNFYFDPVKILETIKFPVLVIFGEKDTQIDVKQSEEAYRNALNKAGNTELTIKIFPNADHTITFSETGCMKESDERQANNKIEIAPGYLELMRDWLKDLK
jgi:dienelactone hydrolase